MSNIKILFWGVMAVAAVPLMGVGSGGESILEYLRFEPTRVAVAHMSFSWWFFAAHAALAVLFLALLAAPPLRRRHEEESEGFRVQGSGERQNGEIAARTGLIFNDAHGIHASPKQQSLTASLFASPDTLNPEPSCVSPLLPAPRTLFPFSLFPWWGWLGLLVIALAWLAAWTRLPVLAPVQRHTFMPLWIGFILTMAALTQARKGSCLMTSSPSRFIALFPASAAFWWIFEYLNRFVRNWHYSGVDDFSNGEYALFATISFSTVLPAVMSTTEFLGTFRLLNLGYQGLPKLRADHKKLGMASTLLGVILLLLAGRNPELFFGALWVGPLLVFWGLMSLSGRDETLAVTSKGDWRPVAISALAALVCGFFWEMWNFGSLARWDYSVPGVDRFHLFAMPALGYMGYLPFGLECFLATELCLRIREDVGAKIRVGFERFAANVAGIAAAALAVMIIPAWFCSTGHQEIWRGERGVQEALGNGACRWMEDGKLSSSSFKTGSTRFDGEWLFGTHLMTAMGLGQIALRHPAAADGCVRRMEKCFDGILTEEARAFDKAAWGTDPIESLDVPDQHHAAYLGYFNLALSLARLVDSRRGDDAPDGSVRLGRKYIILNDRISEALSKRLRGTKLLLLQTYPHEIYPVDNCAVAASVILRGRVIGDPDIEQFAPSWEAAFRRDCIDQRTGLVHQALHFETGAPIDLPRGSGSLLGSYFLNFSLPALSKEIAVASRKQLATNILGFALLREYPQGAEGGSGGDIDSGPIILGYGVSATGFALAACRTLGDETLFTRLYATATLAGSPVRGKDDLHWITGGPIGDSILFAMLTALPEPLKTEGGRR